MSEPTYLDDIVAWHRRRAADQSRPLAELRQEALQMPPTRNFAGALAQVEGLGVIAEVKRRSPSMGSIRADLDPATMATRYADGGATCLSVLTDEEFFGGSAADLAAARAAVDLPVLRKDFTVCEADVYDARRMGADAVLLIVAVLSDDELATFLAAATEVGLDALVEVHDEHELQRALKAGASMVGVNQRDLRTFAVDQERAVRVASSFPTNVVRVAESGVRGPTDAATLYAAGFDAVLVGTSLVASQDPADAVRDLRAVRKVQA